MIKYKTTLEEKKFLVVELHALTLQTNAQLMKTLAKAFSFPSYFGQNLDALHDCMTDLGWLEEQNYKLIIRKTTALENKNIKQLELVKRIFEDVERYWKQEVEDSSFVVEYS